MSSGDGASSLRDGAAVPNTETAAIRLKIAVLN
jgi:hypothetical protein